MAIPTRLEYESIQPFQKDLKKLLKKYRTLEEDLETAKTNAIELYHIKQIYNDSIFPIPNFCTDKIQVCKLKRFACRSLKGRGVKSGIRVIYAFHTETHKVDFIEMYFKGEKQNQDDERITDYLRSI